MIERIIQRATSKTPGRLSSLAGLLAIAAATAGVLILSVRTTAADTAGSARYYPQGLSGYEIVTAVTEASVYDVQSTSARCSRGKKVLGGGASIMGSSGAAVFWNGPARTKGTGSWAAAAQEITATNGPWSLEVYAICAYAGTATRSEG